MKRLPIFIFLVLPAFPQIKEGSLGIAYFTNEKIVMVGDSRITLGGLQFDDQCKVAAPGGNIVFVTAGAASFISPLRSSVPSWDNLDEAHVAYKKIIARYSTPAGHLLDIANSFAESLRLKWTEAANHYRAQVEEGAPDGGLTRALFGGRDSSGRLQLVDVFIAFQASNVNDPVSAQVGYVQDCPSNFCSFGNGAIAVEFIKQTTPRAAQEAKTWRPSPDVAPKDVDIERTMRLVELTIKLDDRKTVGGPIDAVQLSRGGDLRWYRRKANCPAE